MEFTTSDGININYHKSGNGLAVICIHGWTMCRDIFNYLHQDLLKNTVISLDLRGHGKSGYQPEMEISYKRIALDVIELLQDLNLDSCILLGWSFGVNVILENWFLLKEYSRGLVLLHGTPRFIAGGGFCDGMRLSIANRLENSLNESYETALMGFYKLIYFSEEIDDRTKKELDMIFDVCKKNGRKDVNMKVLKLLYESDSIESLSQITDDVQIVTGEIDKVCFAGASRYMFDCFPASNMLIVPDGGHTSFFTKRKIVTPVIKRFVEEH